MPWTKIAADKKRAHEKSNSHLREGTYREAILEATMGCMESDKDVFVLGEGVDDTGGVFGTTKGLIDIFGEERVIDTPLAENGITGIAIMPASPYDAKGLLISSIYDNNPVLYLEHRWLYDNRGPLPEDMYRVPLGKASVKREGTDVTIVAISQMVGMVMEAAESLENENIECEVIDLRSIKPLDTHSIRRSVQKTGRLVVADTAWKEFGVSAEILALILEDPDSFRALKAPAARVTLPDVPTPASPALEAVFYPGPKDIISAVKKTL